jgi:hypothetical protein
MSTASLIRLLVARYPDDDAVATLSKHFDNAVADITTRKFICTRKNCSNRTDDNE